MRHHSLILTLVLVSPSAFAKRYILGGAAVEAQDPVQASTVALYTPSRGGRGGSLCTASLLKKDIALTAAHCVEPGGPRPVLLFGRDIHSSSTPRRQVDGVVVNPAWRTRAGHGMDQGDIALVKFAGGIPEGYKKITTASADSDIRAGSEAVLAGYGISDARTHEGAGVLRKTAVQILKNRPGKSEMILDQHRGRGACHGDSGGPAFIQKRGRAVLAGVTNRGYPNRAPDDCAHQVVYTKVPAYRSWIQKNEKKLESSPAAPAPAPLPALWGERKNGLPKTPRLSKEAAMRAFRPQRARRSHARAPVARRRKARNRR